MQIHQSAEDYLETILMLTQRMGRVRSIDVVNELGYTKASVSIAMKKLRENGYIAVDGEGNLTLLEPGREIAERIYSRHRLLTHFFVQLGVDEDDRCRGRLQGRAYPQRGNAGQDPRASAAPRCRGIRQERVNRRSSTKQQMPPSSRPDGSGIFVPFSSVVFNRNPAPG